MDAVWHDDALEQQVKAEADPLVERYVAEAQASPEAYAIAQILGRMGQVFENDAIVILGALRKHLAHGMAWGIRQDIEFLIAAFVDSKERSDA